MHNLKNVKNTHGGVLLLLACNCTKSNTPPMVFFTFFKLYEWYQIAQSTTILKDRWSLFVITHDALSIYDTPPNPNLQPQTTIAAVEM